MPALNLSESTTAGLSATVAHRVAADLRRRILQGELVPGQRLKIDELAAMCAVSHMPIRQALGELEGEGVLELVPHRGAVIKGVDIHFVRNLYDVRQVIEGLLVERCAARIEEPALQQLEAAVAAYEAVARTDTAALLQANRRFHDTINAVADNPPAVRMLGDGRVLIEALRLRFRYGPTRIDEVVEQHREIFRAIAAHQVERAGRLARVHCMGACEDLLATFNRGS